MRLGVAVEGIDEVLALFDRIRYALTPQGKFGESIRYIVTGCYRYAVSITHVVTGRLRAGHEYEITGLSGQVYNRVPYAAMEHERGGSHAFYERTVTEAGPRLGVEGAELLMEGFR